MEGSLSAADYTQSFCTFMTENPTVFHTVDYFSNKLIAAGFEKLSERSTWTSTIKPGGKYFVTRNGSSIIAFSVGVAYRSGNGIAMVAGHVDANTMRLKPVSKKQTKAGYVQLGVAPYGGSMTPVWWDRDLGIAGRVLLRSSDGKVETKLVKLGWPIGRLPSKLDGKAELVGTNNKETEMVPIIGLESSEPDHVGNDMLNDFCQRGEVKTGHKPSETTIEDSRQTPCTRKQYAKLTASFADSQPPTLVRAISKELNIQDPTTILNWELELYDFQPAQLGGLDKEFIFAGRLDDKLCSWAALEALLASSASPDPSSGTISLAALFDDEEIGSLLRQGANSTFLPSTISRACEALSKQSPPAGINRNGSHRPPQLPSLMSQTYARSFLVSADVTHAANPNFLASYMPAHTPSLNTGVAIKADANGHMTTDAVSSAILQRIADISSNRLQIFMAPGYGGGTVGPMLSARMGVRGVDVGIPQLSMHSVRAVTGNLDPGLGVGLFRAVFEHFESVNDEFIDT